MNLSNFIVDNIEPILVEWENFAKTLFPPSQHENTKKLRDHAKKILLEIAKELTQHQTAAEQIEKSKGKQIKEGVDDTPAELHGEGRMVEGLNINEMMSEFRALRASVTKLYTKKTKNKFKANDISDLIRFNEEMDKALSESIASFSSAVERQNRLFDTMLSSSPDLSYILDLEGKFLYVNSAMSELFQKDAIELIGETIYNLAMPSKADIVAHIEHIIQTGEQCSGEILFKDANNKVCFFEYIYVPVFDKKGRVEAIACASRDISEKKLAEETIWQNANYDPLTELNNRRLFREKLDQALKHSKRTGENFSLLFIDLDGFKEVNDTFGHQIGDILLKKTAKRIKNCMRETDIISRIGGDEFTVILDDAGDTEQVLSITKNVLDQLSKPFTIDKQQVNISASIGIAISPEDGITPDDLIKNADKAMYFAKKKGGNALSVFKDTLNPPFLKNIKSG